MPAKIRRTVITSARLTDEPAENPAEYKEHPVESQAFILKDLILPGVIT